MSTCSLSQPPSQLFIRLYDEYFCSIRWVDAFRNFESELKHEQAGYDSTLWIWHPGYKRELVGKIYGHTLRTLDHGLLSLRGTDQLRRRYCPGYSFYYFKHNSEDALHADTSLVSLFEDPDITPETPLRLVLFPKWTEGYNIWPTTPAPRPALPKSPPSWFETLASYTLNWSAPAMSGNGRKDKALQKELPDHAYKVK